MDNRTFEEVHISSGDVSQQCWRKKNCRCIGDGKRNTPWLVWLSGLSASLRTKGSQVQFPVRAHVWVVGQIPNWGHQRQLHIDVSLPLFLLPFPSLKINKYNLFLRETVWLLQHHPPQPRCHNSAATDAVLTYESSLWENMRAGEELPTSAAP